MPALNTTNFRPGPKQLTIITANANGAVSSVNGITLHVLGSNGTGTSLVTYNPPIVNVAPPPPLGTGSLQAAIDSAAAGSLIVLSPGTYNENVLVWKPVKLQGLGPGGIIGAHELQGRDPDDPRFNVKGSVIDGRFFQQNAHGLRRRRWPRMRRTSAACTSGTLNVVLRGADLTVVAQTHRPPTTSPAGATGIFSAARIDGLGLMTGHGEGAGGIQLQANINNMQITNNVLENNGGVFAGGIGLGQLVRPRQPQLQRAHGPQPPDRQRRPDHLRRHRHLLRLEQLRSGEQRRSARTSASSTGPASPTSASAPTASIHDNRIYYNEAVDSGGGIAIESELPVGGGA